MKENSKVLFINRFWIKIIALIAMTFSHVGILLYELGVENSYNIFVGFDSFGRIALPLFCFGIAEGVAHTKSFGKYTLRLGVLASIISTILLISRFVDVPGAYELSRFGNIYLDLLLGAVAVWFLKKDNKYLKVLLIIPLGIAIASYVAEAFEIKGTLIHWFPWFLRGQYGFYGVLLIVLFFFATKLSEAILSVYANKIGSEKDVIFSKSSQRFFTNLLSIVFLIGVTLLYVIISGQIYKYFIPYYQWYAILGGLIILFYNAKEGYNAKWFKHCYYLYYPVHMILILFIYLLLSL